MLLKEKLRSTNNCPSLPLNPSLGVPNNNGLEFRKGNHSSPSEVNPCCVFHCEQEYDIDFTADIVISGCFAFWSTQKIDLNNEESGTDLHWLWYPCIANALREFPQPNYRWRPSYFHCKRKIHWLSRNFE